MADSTLDITQTFDLPQKLLKVVDNGDGTYSIAVSALSPALPSGAATAANQTLILNELQTLNSLIPDGYDYIGLTYTGDNLTGVVFKTGGAGGTTISTLTLAYTGARLDSVTKT